MPRGRLYNMVRAIYRAGPGAARVDYRRDEGKGVGGWARRQGRDKEIG